MSDLDFSGPGVWIWWLTLTHSKKVIWLKGVMEMLGLRTWRNIKNGQAYTLILTGSSQLLSPQRLILQMNNQGIIQSDNHFINLLWCFGSLKKKKRSQVDSSLLILENVVFSSYKNRTWSFSWTAKMSIKEHFFLAVLLRYDWWIAPWVEGLQNNDSTYICCELYFDEWILQVVKPFGERTRI